MQKPNKNLWFDRLPESEQAAIVSLRQAGFYINNKFT